MRIRVALRNKKIEELLKAQCYDTDEIYRMVDKEFPEWAQDKRDRKGQDGKLAYKQCLVDIQRMAIRLRDSGVAAAFVPRKQPIHRGALHLPPSQIVLWFREVANVQQLSWTQKEEIAAAIGVTK